MGVIFSLALKGDSIERPWSVHAALPGVPKVPSFNVTPARGKTGRVRSRGRRRRIRRAQRARHLRHAEGELRALVVAARICVLTVRGAHADQHRVGHFLVAREKAASQFVPSSENAAVKSSPARFNFIHTGGLKGVLHRALVVRAVQILENARYAMFAMQG